MGIGFLGIGFQPKWGLKDIPIMPKVFLFVLSIVQDFELAEHAHSFICGIWVEFSDIRIN